MHSILHRAQCWGCDWKAHHLVGNWSRPQHHACQFLMLQVHAASDAANTMLHVMRCIMLGRQLHHHGSATLMQLASVCLMMLTCCCPPASGVGCSQCSAGRARLQSADTLVPAPARSLVCDRCNIGLHTNVRRLEAAVYLQG